MMRDVVTFILSHSCVFFNGSATIDIYTYGHTLSLHDALPISALMDARARGVPVAQVLGEQGAVPRDKIVAAIEITDVGRLATALDFDVRLPKRLLRELKIVVHAQTDTRLKIGRAHV